MQNVDLGGDYGVVAFPDHYAPEDIVRDYEGLEAARKNAPPPRAADINSPSVLDYAKNVGSHLLRGAAGVVASIPEDLAIASSGLNRLFGGELGGAYGEGSPTKPEDRYSYKLGQSIRRLASDVAPTDPRLDKSFWATALPEGIGSSVGFAAGGLAGRALKIPEWLSIAGLGSAASGSDFYNDAKANGADDATAQIASVIGNVVGTSEALPMARILHRLDSASGGTFTKALWESGKSTIEEALQEGVQQLAQNFTAQQLYDKDRSLLQDVGTNSGVGGVTGFLMTSLGSALGIATHPSRVRRAEERQSRDASRARIADVIAKRESEANATTSSGTIPNATGQEETARQEGDGGVRLRDATSQAPLEAQTGTEVAPPRDIISEVTAWLSGTGPQPTAPTVLYRGIPEGANPNIVKDQDYTHLTPWLHVAKRGGMLAGGGFDVVEHPVLPDQLYYRGGALAGDPLESTAVGSLRGYTWEQALQRAKQLADRYYNREVASLTSEGIELDEKRIRSIRSATAQRATSDFIKGTFETDSKNRPGVWVGKRAPRSLMREQPELRSRDEVAAWNNQQTVQGAIDTAFAPQQQEAPIAFVGRVVRDVVSGWQNAPDIQLVDNGGQLPDDVRADAAARNVSTNDIDAVRDSKGTVWIVADKVRDANHARRLLLHEAVGHEGVDRAFGTQQQWETFMQGVAQRHAATPLGAEIRGLYGNDPITVGKEIVAKLAENPGADPTLWQQIVAAVRNWARRVFKVDISDNDIRALIHRGRQAVENGQPVPVREAMGGTSFAISPPPIEGLKVSGAAAQIGRAAEDIYRARESGGIALEGLAYQRKQFKTAQAEMKRLSDLAYGRFGASAQTEEPIVVPDPGEGVGITDGRIVVGDEFVNTLNAAGVPHSVANVQAMQGEIYFENAAKRLNNLQDQIETLMTARVYYQELGVAPSEIEKIDEKLTKLQEQEGTLSGAAHGNETVGGRASEIRANETLRPERMAQRDALGLRPVNAFFGRQVGGYREFLNRAEEAAHLAAALRDAATDPAEIARLTTEASRWLTLPQDVQNSIRSGLSLTDDQRAAAFASMAVVFDDFDLLRTRMKEVADARLPEIDKEERELLAKIANHKITSGMAEVMVKDVLATLDGEIGFTGTLQSQAVTQALRERLTAIQTFALAIGNNLETNKALFQWLANPTTPPVIPVGASYGVDAQTLAMILDEVRRNPDFGSAIVTLVSASQKKLANLPVVQLEQVKALVDAGHMDAARALANRIMGRANARASIAEASLREALKTLDGLNIERLSLQHGVAMFDELSDSPDFRGIRNAVANSPYGLVEPMVANNNTATTLKPFGAKDIPSHPGFVMGAGADPVLKSDWFHKVDQWHVAAQHHLDAYDAAQALHSADPLANPQPSALGFDLPKVRGLRDATQRYVPGSFLELSLLSETKRWKIPRLIREMSKTSWFRQHDVVTKMVGGITGTDLRGRLADFVNHFLIARAVIQQFDDIPKKLHAAMKSHPAVQMNISNYREIWNEMAHWGRMFGSPVRIGFVLPKSGAVVTAEDLSLLNRQGQFEEQLRRRVTETNPTAGIRISSGGRELVRSAAAVGDYGVPRHLNRGADIFISDVLHAYAPVGTPPAINSFDNSTDLSATSAHPVIAFWNKNIPLLIQHVLDVRRGDRAMQLNPTMQATELATESDWRATGTPAIHSVEELVNALIQHAPPMPGWNVRDRIVAGLNEELRQYRDAADKITKERAERAQARTSRVIIAFSADNEFTRPAAKLELPSELYDYGSLTSGEHLTVTSRANHERVVAYATAVQRAVSELQDRLNRYEKGMITEAEAASSYGGDLDEMKQVLGILRKIAKDFEDAYRTGNPTLTQSQWYREGFGFLTSSVLALPPVGLRNMTQGQFDTYIMSRAMGLAGNSLTMWRALLTAIKTVSRAAIDTGLHVLRGTDIGASFLTGKNIQLFTKLADQIATTILSPDYRAAGDRVHELGYDTREKFLERMKRIWEQTEETTTRDDAGALKIKGHRVAGLAGVPIKVMRAALDRIGVQQYDQAINATVLPYATWMQKRMEEVALTYGAERARQGLTVFDATDPRWQLQPHEFGAFKSEQQNKDALGNFKLFLELSANAEGFQLERSMWKFYQGHQAGGHQHLFTDRQFDAMQRRMLSEFNASTPANRSSAAAGNNVVRNLLTLQGYVSDGLLKLINLVAGGSRDRTYLAATLGKLPVLTSLALMAVLIGFMQAGLTGEWEKRIRGRATTLATPFDSDFWSSWKRLGDGLLRTSMAQFFYIGDIILMMRGEVQGNRGFDPVGRVWPLSIVQRWLATARGMWNTAKGSGNVKDTLAPLADYGRQTFPYWLEVENLFGAAQGVIKQGERVTRGEAQIQGLLPDSRQSSSGPSYGPNTIVRRNLGEAVSSYWKAQQGGNTAAAEAALVDARAQMKKLEDFYFQKYLKAGDSEYVAMTKAQRDVWNDYQEINPVVAAMLGKRPTQAQYELLRQGMTGERATILDNAVQAWQAGAQALFGKAGSITREEVAGSRGGGGGGGGAPASVAVGLGGGSLRGGLGGGSLGGGSLGGTRVAGSLGGTRRRGLGGSRTRRSSRGITGRTTTRRTGPRLVKAGGTRRRSLGLKRRKLYHSA